MSTYSDLLTELYMYLKRESEVTDLQPLPQDLLTRVRDTITRLRAELGRAYVRDQLVRAELEALSRVTIALLLLRLDKLFTNLKFLSTEERTLLPEERELVTYVREKVRELVRKYLGVDLSEVLPLQRYVVPGERRELKLVRFLRDHPPLMCSDLSIYGPFTKEDIAYIPAPDAEKLRDKGVAEVVE